MQLVYRHSTQIIRNKSFKYSITELKTPTGRRQPVDYFTSMAEDLNSVQPRTNPASGQRDSSLFQALT